MLWSIRVCSRGLQWRIESLRASTRPIYIGFCHSNQIKCKEDFGKTHLSSRSVYDMVIIFNSFINDTLHIGGFDSGIIRINKMVLEIWFNLLFKTEIKARSKYLDELFHKR